MQKLGNIVTTAKKNNYSEIFNVVNSIDKCIIGSVVEELNQKLKTACDDVFGIDTIVFNNSLIIYR